MTKRQTHTITKVYTRRYSDNGTIRTYVEWSNGSRTEGIEDNLHMQALLARAAREGVEHTYETW